MLTKKHRIFVAEYLVDLDAGRAYRAAGYKTKGRGATVSASRLLQNRQIMDEINKGLAKKTQAIEVTAEYVLQTIIDTIDHCKKPDKQGKIDAANVLKGSELLGRHLKMFTDKIKVSGKGFKISINSTDAKL